MGLASEPVDHRHARMLGKLEQCGVGTGTQHDHIHVARQHTRGIGQGLAPPQLHVGGVEHDRPAAELEHGHLEGDAGTGGGLLEDHGQHGARARGGRLRQPRARACFHGEARVDDGAQCLAVQGSNVEEVLGRHGGS